MTKFASILVMAMLFSIPSFSAEPKPITMPLRKFLLLQLMSSKYDYAEKKFTGIVFHYGKVTIDSDRMSHEYIESLGIIMQKGRFVENGVIHDVGGVEWIIRDGVDRPELFRRLFFEGFVFGQYGEIVSPYPNMVTKWTHTFKRFEFPIIPEYTEKQLEKANAIAIREVERIANTKIELPAREAPAMLRLEAPKSCAQLF